MTAGIPYEDAQALCAFWDRRYNADAGPFRDAERSNEGSISSTIGPENRVVPAALPTPRDPASPVEED